MLVAAAFLIQAVRHQRRLAAFPVSPRRCRSTWSTPLKSPFWEKAAQRYKKVRGLPAHEDGIALEGDRLLRFDAQT